ncbi:MAG: histidine phosphatase family protein [Anaerolineae bacterium]|jgi:broad specificity phosphatase PhoE|nr:histidine phosphatase family protein [Anaerolineae bacterium]
MTTRIVLIRHGQTAWNREARFRGQSDVPLEPFGLRQAEVTARYIAARWPVTAVYASPLGRTMKTAEAVAQAQGLTAQPLEGLIDINFGQFQGLLATEAEQRHPELFHAWMEAPHTVHFPGGESLDIVRSRITAALDDVVAHHPVQAVALVSHTVTNRVLLCAVLGWGNDRFWRMHQETCAVNIFDVEDDGTFTIVQLNDTSHLQSLQE